MSRPGFLVFSMSLPSRERGLKLNTLLRQGLSEGVAPFTGAWIEMDRSSCASPWSSVAPFTGAWIEIYRFHLDLFRLAVAPFTGAWIEISCCVTVGFPISSLPSRERGLK